MKIILYLVLIFSLSVKAQVLNSNRTENFCDSLVAMGMNKKQIPGLGLVILRGDQTFKRGYGFSNVDTKQPVDTTKTLFQLGSVGKLFTAIAVLQQVEQGKLNLQVNINQYLKEFQINNPYPTPITLFHLLTHTPGFNEQYIGYGARSEKDLQSLAEHLKLYTPTMLMEAGKEINYSNYGYAIAGYLVEIASGQSFKRICKGTYS